MPPPVARRRSRYTAATLALLCCATTAACRSGGSAASSRAPSPVAPARSAPATPSSPATATARNTAAIRHEAADAVATLAAKQPHDSISVAALNLDTGARFEAGCRSGMWTASSYKLFALEALLWENKGSVGYESNDAVAAIENSDNPAGYRLFLAAGGYTGLQAAARHFGMKHTVVTANDPTFTRTSASDFLVLARNLVDPHSPLSPAARRYTLRLMSDVEADQRWGVGAVADKDSVVYNKNGWLSIDDANEPGETDGGRWAVTSVGIVRVHHQRVAMAIFTQHQPLMGDGVTLVERLARIVTPVVVPA